MATTLGIIAQQGPVIGPVPSPKRTRYNTIAAHRAAAITNAMEINFIRFDRNKGFTARKGDVMLMSQ